MPPLPTVATIAWLDDLLDELSDELDAPAPLATVFDAPLPLAPGGCDEALLHANARVSAAGNSAAGNSAAGNNATTASCRENGEPKRMGPRIAKPPRLSLNFAWPYHATMGHFLRGWVRSRGAMLMAMSAATWWACGGDFSLSAPAATGSSTAQSSGVTTGAGGSGGSVASGTASSSSGQSSSGSGGGVPMCPGEKVGCVNEWLTEDKGLSGISDIVGNGSHLYIAAGSAIWRVAWNKPDKPEIVAGNPNQSAYADASNGSGARFVSLAGLAIDGTNTLWAVDAGSFTVRSIGLKGAFPVSTLAGKANDSAHIDGDGPPTGPARLEKPSALSLDSPPNNMPHTLLYLVDDNWIRTITVPAMSSPSGGVVESIAGQDLPGDQNNAVGLSASFNQPTEIFVTATALMISDTGNYQVRAMDLSSPNGVSTVCGSIMQFSDGKCPESGYMKGPSGLAGVPGGLALSDKGDGDNTVRTIVNGMLTTVVGAKVNVHKIDLGNDAGVPKPGALAFRSSNGNTLHELFIVEKGTQIRRMILP